MATNGTESMFQASEGRSFPVLFVCFTTWRLLLIPRHLWACLFPQGGAQRPLKSTLPPFPPAVATLLPAFFFLLQSLSPLPSHPSALGFTDPSVQMDRQTNGLPLIEFLSFCQNMLKRKAVIFSRRGKSSL